ncbi:MAG: IS1595 family transposase [Gammaproteobacteria bacterium]|nr:IS1595 family transposase [Gammaproteobacteria bacterium]
MFSEILVEITRLFPHNEVVEQWLIGIRWPEGISCPHCGSENVQEKAKHPTMPHRCRSCRKFFSVCTGTVMQASNLDYQFWVIVIYLFCTFLKSVSGMKLYRDLDITQKSAWHLAHRLRKAFAHEPSLYSGPVEVDETYIGGRNRHAHKRQERTQGGSGEVIVAAAKDRATQQISAAILPNIEAGTLNGFVAGRAKHDATIYTDDHPSCRKLPYRHEAVKHSVSEYVPGQALVNGIESFWALLKRGYHGTFHHFSHKHLKRYVCEFAARYNIRELDTLMQMPSSSVA